MWKAALTSVALFGLTAAAIAQVTLLGNCGSGEATGLKVNSDFTISVYCAVIPVSSCAGTINLSTGCVQPMLGGL